MNTIYRLGIFAMAAAMMASCQAGRNYNAYYNSAGLPDGAYIRFTPGMRPPVEFSGNLQADVNKYLASGYAVIGEMQFNGRYEHSKDIGDFAAEKGAHVVLYTTLQTGKGVETVVYPHTVTSTTTHRGNMSHSGNIYNNYSLLPSYSYRGDTTYSGVSETSTTEWRSYSYTYGIYDQYYVFLAKKS